MEMLAAAAGGVAEEGRTGDAPRAVVAASATVGSRPSMPVFEYSPAPLLQPRAGCPWADTMVLNPAIIPDPGSARLHMLFRASGPWPQKQYAGRPMPYPIFLGYAVSDDGGKTWEADFSRPALAPAIKDSPRELSITNVDGQRVVNYANGCIEDPRLFWLEGKLYLTTACRMFPPGPYWIKDEPTQCAPEWAQIGDAQGLGRAARENLSVTVLWEVDLAKLAGKDYAGAFAYVAPLTDPNRGDNRDAFLFPERLQIGGRRQYVCVHRPMTPTAYGAGALGTSALPSMYLASADSLGDFATGRACHHFMAAPVFEWERSRVGGSFPPIRISGNEWLLGYHGKQDATVGYTQSFMILRERLEGGGGPPVITHRCSERVMYARQSWELAGKFKTPCLFSCAGAVIKDQLLISYGAADTTAGLASVNFHDLVAYVREFDALGHRAKLRAG